MPRLILSLLLALSTIATIQAQEQIITIKTSFAVGDSVYMKVISKESVEITATGLSSTVIEQDWRKYALTDQTITVTGPVLYLATFKNGVTEIHCDNAIYLDRIDCEENELQSLNLDNAPNLTMLFCHKNQLTTLDISACSRLQWVNCSENQLTTIDLSNKPALQQLVCSNNPLTSLDISGATGLQSLECAFCGLSQLDLSAHKALSGVNCGYNQLTLLTTTGCTNLTTLYCERNKLQTIDLSTLSRLQLLKCYLNEITALDFTGCPSVNKIYLESNQIDDIHMLQLAQTLPEAQVNTEESTPQIAVYDESDPLEENVCNKDAVQVATDKGWDVLYYTTNRKYEPYKGADDTALGAISQTSKPIVYPTIATHTLYLSNPDVTRLTCYTMTGECLFVIDHPNGSVDISTLPEGSYLIEADETVTHIEIRRYNY